MPRIDVVDSIVKESIFNYFDGKSYSYGGPISAKALLTQENIDVLKRDFCESLDSVYNTLKDCFPEKRGSTRFEWDVQYVLDILSECRRLRIPKEHHGGMVILHMRYCKGYKEIPRFNQYVVA